MDGGPSLLSESADCGVDGAASSLVLAKNLSDIWAAEKSV